MKSPDYGDAVARWLGDFDDGGVPVIAGLREVDDEMRLDKGMT